MILMTLFTSTLANVAFCGLLAIYKRHPVVLWALLGAALPVSAPIVILCAPRLAATKSSTMPSSALIGWILLSAGAVAAPQMLIGMGFSVNSSQLTTSVVMLLLTVSAIAGGSVILRRRSTADRPTGGRTQNVHALHAIAAVAIVVSNCFNVWVQVVSLLHGRLDGVPMMCVSLLPIVVAVYLLQGRRFARPLLVALIIYSLPLGLALMTGFGWRASLASGDTRNLVETLARVLALVALIIAALLDYGRRRDGRGMALESAT